VDELECKTTYDKIFDYLITVKRLRLIGKRELWNAAMAHWNLQ
jgi:hypothetical protein